MLASCAGQAYKSKRGWRFPADRSIFKFDINLRGESGFKVAEMLHRRNAPFIYSTGYGRMSAPDALKGAAHLEKPFRIEELLHAVSKISHRR